MKNTVNPEKTDRKPSPMELRMGRTRRNAWIARKIEERQEERTQEQAEAEGDAAIMARILGF
jgi:hypothetical protein